MNLMNSVVNSQDQETGNGKISGVVIGVVTNNQDDDGMGRIKVKFPWRDENADDSYWARIASLMAGPDRGAYFLPEVGDEVLVTFPPETNDDGKNNIRKIKSRSGHEIIFNDDAEASQEKLEIHTKAGHKITLDDSSGGEKIEIIDKSGNNSMTIDSVQNEISIKSSMKLSIESQMIEIKSGGMMNIEATGNLTIKGAMVMIN
jgi:uncharacterized protein involved in type VI secretion and phage assembly